MSEIPFVAFGDELADLPKLGDKILCSRCGRMHKVRYGKKVLEDGRKVESKTIAFVKCGGELYLVGVKGKDITSEFSR